jgi:hypothetical protein
MTEPASLTAMRQLVEEARLRRAAGERERPCRPSAPARPPVEDGADDGEDDPEEELADADPLLSGAEPGHRGHEQDDGDGENEEADEALPAGVAAAGRPGNWICHARHPASRGGRAVRGGRPG